MRYTKTRLKVQGTREQSRNLLGQVEGDLDALIKAERAFYSWQQGIQAVEDASGSVIAVFNDGTVRITTWDVTRNA